MWRTAFLWFDGAEVLHIPPDATPRVLPEPIQQRREMDRVPCGASVVVVIRVHRRSVAVYSPVRIQGEGQERRRPVPTGEHPPHCPLLHRSTRQIRCILAAPG